MYKLTDEGFGYIYYSNKTRDTYLNEEIDFKVFDGLKLKKPHRGTSAKMSVAPGGEYILILRMKPESDIKMNFGTKTSFAPVAAIGYRTTCYDDDKAT